MVFVVEVIATDEFEAWYLGLDEADQGTRQVALAQRTPEPRTPARQQHMKSWNDIKRKGKISPERGAEIEKKVDDEIAQMNLAQLRKAANLTQAQMAAKLKAVQSRLSQIEKLGADHKLSTLRTYVHALGGEMKVRATIKGKTVELLV
jgi:DNA-binding XRE family transcriptional regulator